MNPRTICLAIAGLRIGFSLTDKRLAAAITRRYHGYEAAGSGRPRITINCACTRTRRFPGGEKVRLSRLPDGGWRARRRDFEFSFTTSGGTFRLHPSIYTFDAGLRVLLATQLPHRGGFLLHASAVVAAGRALVFAGKSGSGKTTIARLLRPATIINDEIICLSRSPGGTWRVHGTPFWGEMGTGPVLGRPVPLGAVHFLRKARHNEAVALPPTEALSRLLRCVCAFTRDASDAQRLIDAAVSLVESSPVRLLSFVKQPSIAAFLLNDSHAVTAERDRSRP